MKRPIELNQVETGKRLNQVRKSLDRTLSQMSELSGFSISAIAEMENGKNNPNHDYLLLLAERFNLNLNWLFTGKGAMFLPDFEIKWDFGKDTPTAMKLVYMLENHDEFRFSALGFFSKFLKENNKKPKARKPRKNKS